MLEDNPKWPQHEPEKALDAMKMVHSCASITQNDAKMASHVAQED